jgi:outer membrane protein TolC
MKHLLILGILMPAGLYGQQGISLEQAIQTGLQNNLSIQRSVQDVAAAEWKVKEYKSIGYPQVNGEVNFQNFITLPTTLIPAQAFNPSAPEDQFMPVQFGTNFNVNGAITLSQLLFDGSYITGLKAAKLYPVISQQQLDMARRDLTYNIKSAYYNAVVAKAGIGILEELKDTTIVLLKKTGLLIAAGVSDSSNYDQLELTIMNLEVAINRSKRNYQLALQLLKHQMGVEVDSQVEPDINLMSLLQSIPPAELSEEFNPAVLLEHKLLETQVGLLELQTQVTKNKKLPSVGAFFTHQQQAMKNDLNLFEKDTWYPSTLWGLKIGIPIWSSGQLKAVVKQNEIEVAKTMNLIKETDRNMMLRAAQAKTNYASSLDAMIAERKNIELAEKILRRNMKKYAEGVLSSLLLTQAQTQYLNAQSAFIMASMDLLNARVELEKSLNK